MNLSRIRAVILDLDGVVYLEDRLIPGAGPAIRELRRRGIKALFVTNNATATRRQFAARLSGMGVPCAEAEVMNTGRAAAVYVRRRYGRGAGIYGIGEQGLAAEMRLAGMRPVTVKTRAAWERFQRARPRFAAVVVSFDRTLTYWEVCGAHISLRRGAELIACNLDPTWPIKGGDLPGTGALVALVERASGRTPFVIGKPSPVMFRQLLEDHGLEAAECLVIGDRLPIDIRAGRALGSPTALVLTGIDSRADVARSPDKPHLVLKDLPALLKLPGLPLSSPRRGG
jgi:phosphoglycolate/pyridoxal phosphate phosphatase family enzyme